MKVDKAKLEKLLDETTDAEVELMAKIAAKYNANVELIAPLMLLIQVGGFGRNKETSNAMRAVADMIDSDLPKYEDLEERARKES